MKKIIKRMLIAACCLALVGQSVPVMAAAGPAGEMPEAAGAEAENAPEAADDEPAATDPEAAEIAPEPVEAGQEFAEIDPEDAENEQGATEQDDPEEVTGKDADDDAGTEFTPDDGPVMDASAYTDVQNTSAGTYYSISGPDRYATAVGIAKEAFPNGTSEVILVTGAKFPDALSANAYAGAKGAAILLTSLAKLSDETKKLLSGSWKGKVKNVTIIGGGFSSQVFSDLKACGFKESQITQIAGSDRYETARLVCQAGLDSGYFKDAVIVATGQKPADALSVSPWSYGLKMPILLARNGQLDGESLKLVKRFSKVILLGSDQTVAKSCANGVSSVRLGGKDRYETSVKIADHFVAQYKGTYENMAFAHGSDSHFPDALVGGMLQGQKKAPVILTNETNQAVQDFILFTLKDRSVKTYYFLGAVARGKGKGYDRTIAQIAGSKAAPPLYRSATYDQVYLKHNNVFHYDFYSKTLTVDGDGMWTVPCIENNPLALIRHLEMSTEFHSEAHDAFYYYKNPLITSGLINKVSYAGGQDVFEFTVSNKLLSMCRFKSGSTVIKQQLLYEGPGRLYQITGSGGSWPAAGSGWEWANLYKLTYDSQGRTSSVTVWSEQSQAYKYTVTYDSNGRVSSFYDFNLTYDSSGRLASAASKYETCTFGYDSQNRIKTVTCRNSSGKISRTFTLEY